MYDVNVIKNHGLEPLFNELKPIIGKTMEYILRIYTNHFKDRSIDNYCTFIHISLRTLIESYCDFQSFVKKNSERPQIVADVTRVLIDKLFYFAKDNLIQQGWLL